MHGCYCVTNALQPSHIPTFITRVRVRARSFRVIFQELTSRYALGRRDDHLIQQGFVVCQAIAAPRRIALTCAFIELRNLTLR